MIFIKATKRSIVSIASILIFFLLVGCVSAANDTIDNVSSSVDDNTLDVNQNSNVKSFYDLQDEVNNLSSGDTLDLDCDYKYDGNGTFDGVTIATRDVVIDGHGHTLDANSGDKWVRIFWVNGASGNNGLNVTLKNIVFTNANLNHHNVDDEGGAVWGWYSDGLQIINCTFINNYAYWYGGAVATQAHNVVIRDCTFINNSAEVAGGAINNNYVGVDIFDCSFYNNSAPSGGGVYSAVGHCFANDNWWGNNTPDFNSDALVRTYAVEHNTHAVLNLTATYNSIDVKFYRNGTDKILPISRDFTLTIGNESFTARIVNGTYHKEYTPLTVSYNVTASLDGEKQSVEFVRGNIYVDPINGNDTDYGFDWDTPVQTITRALELVFVNHNIYLADGTYTIPDTAINKTVAIVGNGSKSIITSNGISRLFSISANNVSIYNCTIADNTPVSNNVIYVDGNGFTLSGCTFVNNNPSSKYVIYNEGNGFTVNNCTFNNNKPAISAIVYNSGTDFTVGNSTFINNSASAIRNNYGTNFVVGNSTFINNTAGNGPAIYNYGSSFTVDNSIFINNYARSAGGVIMNNGGMCTITNSVFINNTADKNGDVIYNYGGSSVSADTWWGTNSPNWEKLVYGNDTHNTYAVLSLKANDSFIAINFYRNGTEEVLPFSRSLNLTIANETTSEEIVNGTFTKNYTPLKGNYDIYAAVDNETLITTIVHDVYVSPNGNDENDGAYWERAVKTIGHALTLVSENCNIYLSDGTHEVDELVTINKTISIVGNGTKTIITNNKNNKGVFYVTASNVGIYNASFVNNTADLGSAIFNNGVGVTVANCSFINNNATTGGGAICNYNDNFRVYNSTFINNSASSGSAIWNLGENSGVNCSIFIDNSLNGAVIYSSVYSFDINDNWWSTNSPDWDKLLRGEFTNDNHVVLTLTATTSSVELKFYRNGTDEILPISRNVSLTIDNTTISCKIVNGTYETTYSVPKRTYTITAVVDNEKQTINFTKDIYVSPEGNDDKNGSSWDNAVKTISHAIEIVPSGGVIYIADGTYNVTSQITISKPITIIGNGTKTVITNNRGGYGVFTVKNNVSFYNCAFVNSTADYGGAIYNVDGESSVIGCSFINNTAIQGGAIYNLGDLNVSNSAFINNTGSKSGYAIFSPVYCDANNNWWGNNTPDWQKLINRPVIHNTYAVLNLTANDTSVALNFYKNGTDEVLPISRDVSLTIDDINLTGKIVNGTYKTTYYISAGNYPIVAVVDNEKIAINFVKHVYVSLDGDDKNEGYDWDHAVKTIARAMEIGGVIYLSDGIHELDGQIRINETVTIIGNGSKTFITNSHDKESAFFITADNVAIYNATFANNTAVLGGAIYNEGVNLTIQGCAFINNTAEYGGAIANFGSGFSVSNSSFINNKAVSYNAIYCKLSCEANDNWWGTNNPDWTKLVYGTVIHKTYAVLNLTANYRYIGLNFYRNGTDEVLPISREVNLTIGNENFSEKIVDGTFTKEYQALDYEYNITAVADNQKLAISFFNNVYVDYENGNDLNTGANWKNAVKTIEHAKDIVLTNGGIYLADGTHVVANQVTIDRNIAIVGNGTKTVITNNKNDKGVFNIIGNNAAIYNCTFANNTAANGGAIYINCDNVTVKGCSFINNSVSSNGGAIYNYGKHSAVNNCTFINNFAQWDGGAILDMGSNFTVSGSIFINNTAQRTNVTIFSVFNPSTANDNWWGTNNPDWTKLVNYNVKHDSYAVLNLTANDGVVTVNFCRNGTDEILPFSRDVSLTIGNDKFSGKIVNGTYKTNYTPPKGNYYINATVDNQEVSIPIVNYVHVDPKGDDANNGFDWNSPVKTIGHAMSIVPENGRIYLADGTHVVESRISVSKTVPIIGNGTKTLITNNANGKGVFYVSAKNVTIYNCTFINSSVMSGRGGAINNNGWNFTVSNCIFINNTADVTSAEKDRLNGGGGAIYNSGNNFRVIDCVFIDNFANSTDVGGGAIYNQAANFEVINSIFTNNSARNCGGAIYSWEGGDFYVIDSTFNNNSAAADGGAIYNRIGTKVTIKNNTFADNDAKRGVAICNAIFYASTATINLTDNTYLGIGDNKTYIYNTGTILSPVTVTVLGNETVETYYGENLTVFATVTTADGASVSGGSLKFIINDTVYFATSRDNGIYDVKYPVKFTGKQLVNASYGNADDVSVKTGILVVKTISKVNVHVDDIVYGDSAVIQVNVTSGATGNVSITINNKTQVVKLNNSRATLNVDDLNAGDYNVFVTYNGDVYYLKSLANTTFTVNKTSDYNMTVDAPQIIEAGENTTVIVNLPKDATGNVTIFVNDKNFSAEVKDGFANVTISVLGMGKFNITTVYYGDNNYNPMSKITVINVTLLSVDLDVNDVVMTYHDGSRLVAKLTDYIGNPIANATLYFTINGKTYSRTTNDKGSASIALNLESRKYIANVTYKGEGIYGGDSKNATVTINPSIIANNLVKMYQNDTQFHATFLDNHGKVLADTTVRFNINGVFYNRTTNENGTAILNINLNPGNYTLTAYNNVTGEELGFNVLVKSLVETSDLTKYYLNESQFVVKVYNKDGSLANGTNVTFNINGVLYHKHVINGYATLNINLKPGSYVITSMYGNYSVGNNIKVLPTLETSDLYMKYHDGSKFNATVLDGQGKPLANQVVTFNVNGVFYNRTSGDNGIASLNINLNKGKYIITSMWNDYKVGNKIVIS